jgi:hypothetical protein
MPQLICAEADAKSPCAAALSRASLNNARLTTKPNKTGRFLRVLRSGLRPDNKTLSRKWARRRERFPQNDSPAPG